ncbi:uncharacterized protein LOC124635941 [Helicoverpa zea]|uniref:uncharacterized protein LOC124635941 n=1 Tax=Helicoverpa zea TaxID=7113 RepID=UPI001F560FBE|nr:uncharacterized protein LOC124635941 [Helicoverpa zea]
MLNSLSNNTISQYNVALKQWFRFCQINRIDLYNVSTPLILKFLTEQFHRGASYNTLNSYRSALTLILGKTCCSDENITRFLKGVFRIKPCFPKHNTIWDPNLVLNHLTTLFPNTSLRLDKITKKLATLLALSTGQRVQTLSLINEKDIAINETHICIEINNIIKTSAPNRKNPKLIIPFFREKEPICPASTLCSYIEFTKQYRQLSDTEKLFLTTKKPYHNASSQSISRWIKEMLRESGVDVNIFTAHSTRHASTSAASRSGVSIDVIKQTAGWAGNSLCFAKFYNRPLINDDTNFYFAEAIINNKN